MTGKQRTLLSSLQTVLSSGPKNTRQIRIALGHKQAYESSLRDRLLRLEAAGLITHTMGERNSRQWQLVGNEGTK